MNDQKNAQVESEELSQIAELEIEPLSDEALASVAGGWSSDGPVCCSCLSCSKPPV